MFCIIFPLAEFLAVASTASHDFLFESLSRIIIITRIIVFVPVDHTIREEAGAGVCTAESSTLTEHILISNGWLINICGIKIEHCFGVIHPRYLAQ